MNAENKGFSNEKLENFNNSQEDGKNLRSPETVEKKDQLRNQEKLEAYINYLVKWKNEIVAKQNDVKRQVEKILINGEMGGFFHPNPGQYAPSELRGADTLFSKLAEQFQEIQNERNEWANQLAAIYGSPYYPDNIHYPHDKKELVQNYFFAPLEPNEHLGKSIEALNLNIYPTVMISKEVLNGELPLYEERYEDDAISERSLRIKGNKYIVENRYSREDESDNYSQNEKEYSTYEEAERSFFE